jgi:phage tail-like protein
MREQDKNNFFFLNRDGRWPGFQRSGLQINHDGVLRLASVPLFSGMLPQKLKTAPEPNGPAGLAIDSAGAIYFSDPDNNRVMRINGCDGSTSALPCLGGTGTGITQLLSPRGLLVPRDRQVLFVVDCGNHRIQIFDLATFQLVEIWGQSSPANAPQSGSAPGQFNTPWTLAGDNAGNVYVIDYGNARVQKFNAAGDVVPMFWENVLASGLLQQPVDITVRHRNAANWVLILDSTSSSIFAFHTDGRPVKDSEGNPLVIAGPKQDHLTGMAVLGDSLYLGDNTTRRVLCYEVGETIKFVGEAIGYDGPVAALLLDGKDHLVVNPGGGFDPIVLQAQSGFRTQGVLWGGPVQMPDRKVVWHRIQAMLNPLPENVHLDVFFYASSKDGDVPVVTPGAPNPFADAKWQPASHNGNLSLTDLYIGKESQFLWVGVLFVSNGLASPALSQLCVQFDYPSYEQYLPAIYRAPNVCDDFLPRLLSLFASFNEEVEAEIGAIPSLFDPSAAPRKFLGWLAGCLGLDLDENWDEQKQRRIIAEIFRLSGQRGTVAGLRESLRIFAGVDAIIEEPIVQASWWALPGSAGACCQDCADHAAAQGDTWQATGDSILGWTTMLAPAQPQGAVVGTSADLDQSHLITDDDFGSPLFTDVAYRFVVNVYRSQIMCPDSLARIRAVLDREKPAHTVYDLCIIEPDFRVGFQGRLGIDTVVAGSSRSLALGSNQLLGKESVLAGVAAGRLGAETRLGISTRL